MKKQVLKAFVVVLGLSSGVQAQELTSSEISIIKFNGGDLTKVPVRQEPAQGSDIINEVIHSKTIQLDRSEVTFKWTALGYGSMTHKVIIQELTKHTVFNHRNDGEDGPCLKSDKLFFSDGNNTLPNEIIFEPQDSVADLNSNPDPKLINPKLQKGQDAMIEVSIQIKNRYIIDRPKKICKVLMVEDVRTIIDSEEFYHVKTQDMGFRLIDDCPK